MGNIFAILQFLGIQDTLDLNIDVHILKSVVPIVNTGNNSLN